MIASKKWTEGIETDQAIELIGRGLSAQLDADGNVKPRKKYSRNSAAVASIALYQVDGGQADSLTIERIGCRVDCHAQHDGGRHRFGTRVTLSGSAPEWEAEAEAWNDEGDYYSLTALALCRALLMFEGDPDASRTLGRLKRELLVHKRATLTKADG